MSRTTEAGLVKRKKQHRVRQFRECQAPADQFLVTNQPDLDSQSELFPLEAWVTKLTRSLEEDAEQHPRARTELSFLGL